MTCLKINSFVPWTRVNKSFFSWHCNPPVTSNNGNTLNSDTLFYINYVLVSFRRDILPDKLSLWPPATHHRCIHVPIAQISSPSKQVNMSFITRFFSSDDTMPPALQEAGNGVTRPIIQTIWTSLVSYLPVSVSEFLGMVDFEESQVEKKVWTPADDVEFHVMEKAKERRPSVRGGKSLPIRQVQDVNGIKTELILWDTDDETNVQDVFIMIPGNPGLAEFYVGLLEHIYQESGRKIACVGVSYAAHSQILRKPVPTSFKHTLEEQIQHKIDVFDVLAKEWYPKAKFWIAGHSIGGYVSLRVLKARSDSEYRIAGVFGLFPTVEGMKTTPNGTRLSPLFRPGFRNAAAALVGGLASMLPSETFVDVTQKISKTPRQLAEVVATQLLHHDPLMSVLTMADCEMNQVTTFDEDLIRGKLDRVVMYYGEEDEWAPLYLANGMQERFPEGKILIDQHKLPHAFMLHPHGQDIIGHYALQWMAEIKSRPTKRVSIAKPPKAVSIEAVERSDSNVDANAKMFSRRRSVFETVVKPKTLNESLVKSARQQKEWVVEAKKSTGDLQ